MTLHEAMKEVLVDAGRPLNTIDIAGRIKTLVLYRKRDGSPIQPNQVRARARKYPQLFSQVAGAISLARWGYSQQAAPIAPTPCNDALEPASAVRPSQSPFDSTELAEALLEPSAFRPPGNIDLEVPNRPGLYAIRVRDKSALPHPFGAHAEKRGHDLLYLGLASKSLSRRLLHQELRPRGHGTFFRSIGAILGYRPLAGSLVGKGNIRNYRFTPPDNQAIIDWINANLLANWVEFSGAHAVEESALIREHLPLLNLQDNPVALPELSVLRAECARIANLSAA